MLMQKHFFSGSTHLVVLGVVIVAIVVSIMTIHWAKIIYEECYSDRMVYLLLIVLSALGLVSGVFLISLRFKRKTELCVFSISNHTTGITFMKIKLVFMFIFGICYLFHCGLYVWKHTFENKCFGNNDFGFAYNVISIFYTCTLFVYFSLFYGRKDNTCCENLASLFIMVTNACIWLDTIFSESGKVFNDEMNVTESTTILDITNHSSRATEAIKITDSFLSPASIEFSLLSIDMLFTQTSPTSNHKKINEDTILKKELAIKRIFQIIFSLIAIALFAFTLVVVLTNDESTDLPDYPDDFKFYVYYQVGIKGLMFILIMCLLVELPRLTFHVNVSTFVLLVACFGNVSYHFLYCIALGSKNNTPFDCPLILSLLENICGILLALFQSVFIIGTHMPKDYAKHSDESRVQKCKDWLHKNVVYYACCLLGILNLGLWVSDSIGELRLPVFSITIYKAFGTRGWSIINKIILPLTIFFRFHTAFDFLEYYWKHDTMIDNELENAQLGIKDQNDCYPV